MEWSLGVISRRHWQFWCSIHRGRVLLCRAAPWPVIENIDVVLKNYYKKRGTRRSGGNPGLCGVKVYLQKFVRNCTKDIKNCIRMPELFYFTDFTFHKEFYAWRVVINCNVFTPVHSNCCGTGIAERFERWPPASVVKSILKRPTFKNGCGVQGWG